MTGETLYNMYVDAMSEQGVEIDETYETLDPKERAAYDYMADQINVGAFDA